MSVVTMVFSQLPEGKRSIAWHVFSGLHPFPNESAKMTSAESPLLAAGRPLSQSEVPDVHSYQCETLFLLLFGVK